MRRVLVSLMAALLTAFVPATATAGHFYAPEGDCSVIEPETDAINADVTKLDATPATTKQALVARGVLERDAEHHAFLGVSLIRANCFSQYNEWAFAVSRALVRESRDVPLVEKAYAVSKECANVLDLKRDYELQRAWYFMVNATDGPKATDGEVITVFNEVQKEITAAGLDVIPFGEDRKTVGRVGGQADDADKAYLAATRANPNACNSGSPAPKSSAQPASQ